MRLLLIDYGMGNLTSVSNAFGLFNCELTISRDPIDIKKADKIVLPGVGAFNTGIEHLKSQGWVQELQEAVIVKKKPFLGVCLGIQLIATLGTEHDENEGLNWIRGRVERLRQENVSIRIPHIGWNDVNVKRKEGLYKGMKDNEVFYFMHSYAIKVNDPSVISGTTLYGDEFVASIEKDNIFAVQFHPEKSQKAGLKVFQNFVEL